MKNSQSAKRLAIFLLPNRMAPWERRTHLVPLFSRNLGKDVLSFSVPLRKLLSGMGLYKRFVFPILSSFDPEQVHYGAMRALVWAHKVPGLKYLMRAMATYRDPSLERSLMGLTFPNPVGLAAGFDKNGVWIDELASLGFGFVEIGTVTPKAQLGNPKPRLFRLKEDEALINRMGFNNNGSAKAAQKLKKRRSKIIVGGNIGKNKITENMEAVHDYRQAFLDLYEVVDYFVVNVSSPNTPGLRELQEKGPLKFILRQLMDENRKQAKLKPILLKIAPDLTLEQLDDIVEIVQETEIAGVIATNTTIERSGLSTSSEEIEAIGAGGLSGKPLKDRSTEVIRYLAQKSQKSFVIIGVGGIQTAEDAQEKLAAGADLIQVYSGFVYEGPRLAYKICAGLVKPNA